VSDTRTFGSLARAALDAFTSVSASIARTFPSWTFVAAATPASAASSTRGGDVDVARGSALARGSSSPARVRASPRMRCHAARRTSRSIASVAVSSSSSSVARVSAAVAVSPRARRSILAASHLT
jgi:hypothetical protein